MYYANTNVLIAAVFTCGFIFTRGSMISNHNLHTAAYIIIRGYPYDLSDFISVDTSSPIPEKIDLGELMNRLLSPRYYVDENGKKYDNKS